jgi:hypothetical protein
MADDRTRKTGIPSSTEFDQIVRAQGQGMLDTSGGDANAIPGGDDKALYDAYPDLTRAELDRLSILPPGTELEQGAVYFDLNRPGDGPFKALGGQVAGEGTRLIAKRATDYEIWNRIVADDRLNDTEPVIERPQREPHSVENQANLND